MKVWSEHIVYYRLREKKVDHSRLRSYVSCSSATWKQTVSVRLMMFPAEKLNSKPVIPDKSTKGMCVGSSVTQRSFLQETKFPSSIYGQLIEF